MNQLPDYIPDLLPVVTWADWIMSRGRKVKALARAEERAKMRRFLWRALPGRVDRAFNPKLFQE